MTDIAITPGNVLPDLNAPRASGTAGETITAGQAVYLDSATHKYLRADNNVVLQEARRAIGIAMHGASLNQPLQIQISGAITIGGTLVAGASYYVSANPGGICPQADVVAGSSVCLIGLAASTTVLNLDFQFPGVTL